MEKKTLFDPFGELEMSGLTDAEKASLFEEMKGHQIMWPKTWSEMNVVMLFEHLNVRYAIGYYPTSGIFYGFEWRVRSYQLASEFTKHAWLGALEDLRQPNVPEPTLTDTEQKWLETWEGLKNARAQRRESSLGGRSVKELKAAIVLVKDLETAFAIASSQLAAEMKSRKETK